MHLANGIHLQLLAAPFPPQVGLIHRLHANATDAVLDAIALLLQRLVFLPGDRAGVTEHMGPDDAVGVGAAIVLVHLQPRQAGQLFL